MSPVLNSLSLFAMLSIGVQQLAAQGRTFPIQSSQNPARSTDASAPTTTVRLAGTVVSSVDGAPIPRALVTSGDQRFAAFTDSQGRFSFDVRGTGPAGSAQAFSSYPPADVSTQARIFLSLNVRKPGFVAGNLNFAVPGVSADRLTLKLVPTGVISGNIYSDSDDLPRSLLIQLVRRSVNNGHVNWFTANTTTANSHGEFRIGNLEPGDYRLFVPANTASDVPNTAGAVSGFMTVYYPNGAREESAEILSVGPGASIVANMRLHNGPFYEVTIPVTAHPGNGFSRAFLLNAPRGLSIRQSTQGYAGHLPDGTYDVLLYSVDGRTQNDPDPHASDAVVKIEVHGKPVQISPVALHPIPAIPVVVRREFTSGRPHAEAPSRQPSINLLLQNVRQDLGLPEPAMKPDSGDDDMQVLGAIPGVYTLSVRPRAEDAVYVASANSGTTDLLRDPFEVLPNTGPRPIEITLRDDVASIDATLTPDPPAEPPSADSPYIILCISLDRPQAMPALAASPGNQVSIPNLAPGRYLLLAARGDAMTARRNLQIMSTIEYSNPDALRDLTQKGAVVTLSPGQKANVQVPLMTEGDN